MVKPYITQPFTNEFDEVINPGDPVIVITMGFSGGINRRTGKYLGLREYQPYYAKQTRQQVVVEVDTYQHGKWAEDGRALSYSDPEYKNAKYERRLKKRISSLWNNFIYKRA